MARRYDSARLSKVERTPQGGIRCDAAVTRSGVLVYPWGREYRPPAENSRSDFLDTLRGAPVTLGHPPEGKVTPGTYRRRTVGHAGDAPREDGNTIVTSLYLQDAAAVDGVESGRLRELSLGYDVDIDPTPGVAPDGERYDAVQRNPRSNHIALIPPGTARGGESLALRLDSNGDAIIDAPDDAGGEEDQSMTFTIRLDGIDYEVEAKDEAIAKAITQGLAKERKSAADALAAETARADAAEGRADQAEHDRDELKTRLDAAEAPETIRARIDARAALEADARRVMGDEADFAGKSDREVRELALRHDSAELDLTERSDDYVEARFDALVAAAPEKREDSLSRARRLLEQRADSTDPVDRATSAFIARLERLGN